MARRYRTLVQVVDYGGGDTALVSVPAWNPDALATVNFYQLPELTQRQVHTGELSGDLGVIFTALVNLGAETAGDLGLDPTDFEPFELDDSDETDPDAAPDLTPKA